MLQYVEDTELKARVFDIAKKLRYKHIDLERLHVYKSRGSTGRRVIARCHALPKIWQKTLKTPSAYAIEFVSEKFDKLCKADQDKVIIHELMHIPHTFGGGFRNHKFYVTRKNVEREYNRYMRACKHENM